MTGRLPTTVRALYRQLPDGRFLLRFSDRPQLYEGRTGEKLDRLVDRVLAQRPELRARSLPLQEDKGG